MKLDENGYQEEEEPAEELKTEEEKKEEYVPFSLHEEEKKDPNEMDKEEL